MIRGEGFYTWRTHRQCDGNNHGGRGCVNEQAYAHTDEFSHLTSDSITTSSARDATKCKYSSPHTRVVLFTASFMMEGIDKTCSF